MAVEEDMTGQDPDLELVEEASPLPVGQYTDRSTVIHPALAGYFNNKMFSDLTVLAPDGRRLHCHQVILSAGSQRFAKLLEQGVLKDEPELPVWGVDSDALEMVLRCFYTGECTLNSVNVIAVLDAAQRLEVVSLANYCEGFVQEVLQPTTCCQLLGQAVYFKMEDLTQQMLAYTETCFSELTSHEDFLTSPLALVTKLLTHHKDREGSDPSAVLRAGWEWLVADSAHNAHVADIAAVVPLPDGLTEGDLLNKSHADQYNVIWRQPEILPLPEPDPVKEEPQGPSLDSLLQAGTIPQLQVLQQAGLFALPGLTEAGGSVTSTHTTGGLLGVNGLGTPTSNWNNTMANEILAQLNAVNGSLGALGPLGTPPAGLGSRLGDAQRAGKNRGTDDDDQPSSYSTNPPSAGRPRSHSSRNSGHRGVCQVEGCNTDLGNLRDYHQRYKICEYHLKIPSVLKDGVQQRFCQQCGRFQSLTEFEGNKRSCRARLQRHNDRRRKRLEEEPPGGYYNNTKKTQQRGDDEGGGSSGQRGNGALPALGALAGAVGLPGVGAAGGRGGAVANWAGNSLANLVALAGLGQPPAL